MTLPSSAVGQREHGGGRACPAGRRVAFSIAKSFPRFHIGESLLPFSTKAFDRLRVREKLDRTFMPKHGGEIVPPRAAG